jgi:hypothetical protein
MEQYKEFYLAKTLKQWANRYHPPADGRERLLQKVATPIPQSSNKFALSWLFGQEALRSDILGMELPRKLTGWLYLSYRPRFGNLSIV